MNNNSEFMPVECLNVPKVLFYDKQYEDLSMDAKLIYALLLDRKEMAIRNEWVDEYSAWVKQNRDSERAYHFGNSNLCAIYDTGTVPEWGSPLLWAECVV